LFVHHQKFCFAVYLNRNPAHPQVWAPVIVTAFTNSIKVVRRIGIKFGRLLWLFVVDIVPKPLENSAPVYFSGS
jgi:hypothetical protein